MAKEKMETRSYRSTKKQNLKVIKASQKQKMSEAQVIRNLIENNL
jgi:hypothetical protein